MTPEGAAKVLQLLDSVASFVPQLDADSHKNRILVFADLMHDAPDDWAYQWVKDTLRRPAQYGADGKRRDTNQRDLLDAWVAEKRRRIDPTALNLPAPPDVIANDTTRVITWERAYRLAIFNGADTAHAWQTACDAVGVAALQPAADQEARYGRSDVLAHIRALRAAREEPQS
ncbi:hypothetical protein GXB85_13675 [Cellulomonas sp. APG4]|uniref:hypothetical protein n=1 Tax=Cellulomonas sp. APG4 TaxID=1538656 RepID=UPI00137B49BC|nr:hypothetical protein [Cellulomonas sp. APG4]NCT91992.1 hypothetical protein [Cellulomonas sp. APG4]